MSYPGTIVVLSQNISRDQGKKVQQGNINAAKNIADVIRTCLGPRAMLKMLMDPMGGIVMTSDGNAILREITVEHPAAKSMIEIARTQDEEVGDGTTSVIILGGELLALSSELLEQMHATLVISAFRKALDDLLEALQKLSSPVNTNDRTEVLRIIRGVIGTKMISKWSDLACNMALDAVRTVMVEEGGVSAFGASGARREIDIKRYARIEKVPGGAIEESAVLNGVMINKDVLHAGMRRRIEKPRIVLLDCPLEYKKGESQTTLELSKNEDFTRMLEAEEEHVKQLVQDLLRVRPDLVVSEKGVSDLAIHYLQRANVTCLRRLRKTDNLRLARVCGATIVSRVDELKEEDVGTRAALFEVRKLGDEYFTFVTGAEPKACTVLLRGASKDVLNEMERNLQDAMCTARNVLLDARLVPGGGAIEMALAQSLMEKSKSMTGVMQWPYRAVASALESLPRTLLANCGANTIRTLTSLRAKHAAHLAAADSAAAGACTWGVNGETGELADMRVLGVWDPLVVKSQTYKTAIETAISLLRIDGIVRGLKKKGAVGGEGREKEEEAPAATEGPAE